MCDIHVPGAIELCYSGTSSYRTRNIQVPEARAGISLYTGIQRLGNIHIQVTTAREHIYVQYQ
jgi:hypothetical protein